MTCTWPQKGLLLGLVTARICLQNQQHIRNRNQDLLMHSLGVRCPTHIRGQYFRKCGWCGPHGREPLVLQPDLSDTSRLGGSKVHFSAVGYIIFCPTIVDTVAYTSVIFGPVSLI